MESNTETQSINPAVDLEGYLEKKYPKVSAITEDAETQPSEPSESSPSASAVPAATPEEPKVSWREVTLDDIDDEFLKGKPVSELHKSQKAAVAAMQKAQREANDLRRELERMRVTPAEPRVEPSPQQQIPNPENDPEVDEINRLLFEDTPAALKLLDKRAEEKARRIARDEYRQASQAQSLEGWRQASVAANAVAVQRAMERYGWGEDEAAIRIQSTHALIQSAVEQYGPGIWTNPDVYLGAAERLFGSPAQATAAEASPAPALSTAPVAPVVQNPPGSGRPAPAPTKPTPAASALSREAQDARRVLAEAIIEKTGIPLNAEEFAKGKRKVTNA